MERQEEYDVLRMFCNILIVLHHSSFAGQILTGGCIGLVLLIRDVSWTLPTFFLLSGYLLFQNIDMRAWRRKIVRRMKRLVVPFFVWNAIFVLLFLLIKFIVPTVVSSFENGGGQSIVWSVTKVLGLSLQPGDPPLWYIRTLMLYVLAAPLLILIFKVKVLSYVWIIVLVSFAIVADLLSWDKFIKIVIPPYSLICFSVGAYIAHCNINLVKFVMRYRLAFFLVGLFGYLFRLLPLPKCCTDLVYCLYAWFWPVVIFGCMGLFRNNTARLLIRPSFFIFACHFIFRPFWTKIWSLSSWHVNLESFLIIPIFCEFLATIGMCCVCYFTLKRFLPAVADTLNGDLK